MTGLHQKLDITLKKNSHMETMDSMETKHVILSTKTYILITWSWQSNLNKIQNK